MDCILPLLTLLFGIFITDISAADTGTELDPFQQYVKGEYNALLQCKYQSLTLRWFKIVNEKWTILANQDAVVNSTKHSVSKNTNTGLYYGLHVLKTQTDDEGIYACRHNNTFTYFIQLNLYVPPEKLYFHGSLDNKLEGIEGTDLPIRCIADGGKPFPMVSILNDTSTSTGIKEVSYTITKISRDYYMKSIVCNATSDALVNPMTTTVQIYLNLKPLTPIFNTNEVSTEETVPLTVSCTSYGSRPAATFTWTIGGTDVTSSSTTLHPVTASNDTKTVKSTLTYNVDRIYNQQIIKCQAFNTVGEASNNKPLDVKYAPIIKVENHTYTQNDALRTVTCAPSGNPDSYTYHKWQHKSRYGEIIREFGGNKTLELPDDPQFRYHDTGEYVCIARNDIKDRDNKVNQEGSGYITVQALPVFTSDTIDRIKQFGENNKAVDIYVNVYSVPVFTSYEWTMDGKSIPTQNSAKYEKSSSPTIVMDTIHGKEVQLDGYNVTLTIRDLKAEDFVNYTVTVINAFGSVILTIILESASVPETPGNFTRIASSSTSITVQWDPNEGGGYKQIFYIQYRVQGLLDWITVTAGEEDINKPKIRRTYVVRKLQKGKAYELQMYAENTAAKRSNVTDIVIAFTDDAGSGPSVAAIVGGIAGCLIAIIIVLLIIVFLQKKRKDNGTPSTKLRTSSESEEEDGLKDNILYQSSQSDGLKKNVLYQSAGSDFESQMKPSTSSEYAVVQKPNAVYAEVNKVAQPKNAKEKKQKDKKGKTKKARKEATKATNNNPEEEYANSAVQLTIFKDGEYANSTEPQRPSGLHTNAEGLEYADLTFGQIQSKNKKQIIHGTDERTIYADVDHTKKAPPPPQESEYEETNIKHGKMA